MKRNILLISVFMVLCLTLFADTDIPAGNVSGTWNEAGSPYNILGEIQIIAGETLTIEDGVIVNFTGHFKLIVEGTLTVDGIEGNPVLFTAADDETGWHGIRFINTMTNSNITYCNFEYGIASGINPDYKGGAIYATNSNFITLMYCSFANCSATTGGAIYTDHTDLILDHVEVTQNSASGAGGGVYFYYSNSTVQSCNFTANTAVYDGGSINCYHSNLDMDYVVFDGNTTEWNGGAFSAYNNSTADINHSVFYGNSADQEGSAFSIFYLSDIDMTNSIVWNHSYINEIHVDYDSSLDMTYSDVQNGPGQAWFTDTCISAYPLFENPAAGNFQITWTTYPDEDEFKSPCIDAGDPDDDYDPDGTITDIGISYFAQTGIQGNVQLSGGNGVVTDVEITITNVGTSEETIINPNANGNFALALVPGTYNVLAELDTYSSYTNNNIVISGELVTLEITLTVPPPGEIVGQVEVEGIGNEELVVVTAGSVSTNPYAVLNPANGEVMYYEYTLSVTPATYDVTAEMPGYVTQVEEDVIVESGVQTPDIDFYLPLVQNNGFITGNVELVGGAGDVQSVVITAGDQEVNPDAEGDYTIEILNGTYTVEAFLDGYSDLRRENVTVTAFNTTANINFELIDGWQPITGTMYNMVLYSTVTYDGQFMPGGYNYQLAAFDSLDNCVGNAVWESGSYFFWNSFYELDGFWYMTIVSNDQTDVPVYFKFYNPQDDIIYDCQEYINFVDGVYDVGANFTIDSPEYDYDYDLDQGWNWVSFNLNPEDPAVNTVFDELVDSGEIIRVKNQTQFANYDEGVGLSGNLLSVQYNTGYMINMNSEYEGFTFTGEKYNSILYPINIVKGWNWINYLNYESLDVATALASIEPVDSTCVKTQGESAVYFGGWIGDMDMMDPGNMYKLSWPDDINEGEFLWLIYPAEDSAERYVRTEKYNPANWELVSGNSTNMVLIADLKIDDNLIADGWAAGVFDKDGNCRSIGKLHDDFWYFTVLGDDPELLDIKIFDPATGTTLISENNFIFESDAVAGNPNETISFTFNGNTDEGDNNIAVYSLSGNYPNPFNPTTEIAYSLAEDSNVLIQIYNVKGQIVNTLVNEFQTSGNHNITWNADNMASGIYFYKLTTNSFSDMKKCILMK